MVDIMRTRRLTNHVQMRVAVAASADPRSVKRFCEGKIVRPMVAERIEKALKAEGIAVSDQNAEKSG